MFLVMFSHNEKCEKALQIANGPVKPLEGSLMWMALTIFWVQASEEDVMENSEKCNAQSSDIAFILRKDIIFMQNQ